jgi:hypothetical protein
MKAQEETMPHGAAVWGELTKALDIRGRLQRNPYGMVAGALGIGFVLGGGLFTRLTARILGTSLRVGLMATLPLLQKQIVQALSRSKSENKKENDP